MALPVSLWFQERLVVAHCYGLQIDGMFGLVRITSSFHPCPPFLRSPSEMGSLHSWPQLPFQLGTPCALMASRHPWAPVLPCATLQEPHSLLEQSKGYKELGGRVGSPSCGPIPQPPLLGKSQKKGRPRLCSSSGVMGGLSQRSLTMLLSNESTSLSSAVI